MTELVKAKINVKIVEYNQLIKQLTEDDEPTGSTHVVGFQIPSEEEPEEDVD